MEPLEPFAMKRLLKKSRDLVVLTGALYSEIALSGLSVFRGLLPRTNPWLEGVPAPQQPRIVALGP